jgi:hypothetical protein
LTIFLIRLAARGNELGLPFNVALERPGDTSVSSEHGDDETLIELAGNGQCSELERRWWISAPVAHEAARADRRAVLRGGVNVETLATAWMA